MKDQMGLWGSRKLTVIERLFGGLKKQIGERDGRESKRALVAHSKPTLLLPNKLLSGGSVPVVGESFYGDSFVALDKLFSETGNDDILRTATLRVDPENEHSPSGKAVAVFIQGLQVGHISESLCHIVFDALDFLGGSADSDCRVHLDTASGDFRFSSVELRMALPPTLEANSSGAKAPSLKKGSSIQLVGIFELSTGAGSLLEEMPFGQSLFMSVNLKCSNNSAEITTTSGELIFQSQELIEGLPFRVPNGGTLYYLEAKLRALGGRAFEISIFTSDPVVSETVRTGDALSGAGNVLSSRYDLGLAPAGDWKRLKVEKTVGQPSGVGIFMPNPDEPTKYFWARVSDGPSVYNQRGFRAYFYKSDIDQLKWKFDSVPHFWVLVRATLKAGATGPIFEASVGANLQLTLFPNRPFVGSKALVTDQLRNHPAAEKTKTIQTVTPTPEFSSSFSVEALVGRQIATTFLNFLEQNYLEPALGSLGFEIGDSVTKSKTGLLVGGSAFNLAESAKAKACARFSIPIVTVETLRTQMHDLLIGDSKYLALCRYESWLDMVAAQGNYSGAAESIEFDFESVDAALIPGGALDERDIFSQVSFDGTLVGLSESKTQLSAFFQELSGQVLDAVVIKAEIAFVSANAGLVMELSRNGVFLGRTPANQTQSLAEAARLYGIEEAWVKIDWLSENRFKASFSFFGHGS